MQEVVKTYDEENKAEYEAAVRAEQVLASRNAKGFRAPSKKDLRHAEEVVHSYKEKKAKEFIAKQQELEAYYELEIGLDGFTRVGPELYQPKLGIRVIPKPAKTKPWSEAMEENLAARINCKHEDNEEGLGCKKCVLPKEHWGEGDEGVTEAYQTQTRERITKAKEDEIKEQKEKEE